MEAIRPNNNSDVLQSMLKESIDRFFTEYRKGATDFSNFTSIFSRFLQKLPNPPLEIVWFYSAVHSHTMKLKTQNFANNVLVAKDLFQQLASCSCSCNALKKIALLAPAIYELYSLVSVSEEKVLIEEIESLLEVIISYISICCSDKFEENEEFGALSCWFVDLVRVWLVDTVGERCKLGEELRVFFPLVNDGIRKEMVFEGRGIGYLAGIVMTEAFLLRLCLKFRLGISGAELEKELRSCAIQMITAFRSYYFVDTLLKLLLEPTLSAITLLNSEDEVFLQEILYDTAMTMDSSFLGPQKGIHLPDLCLKNLVITWLFVADNAMQFLRDRGNQAKVFSCLRGFSASCLPSQLIKWIICQPGIQSETSKPKVSTPLALINWLLTLEDQGLRVFDSDISKMYAKNAICKSRIEQGFVIMNSNGKNLGENQISYYNNNVKRGDKVDGDLEMMDSEGSMLLATPRFLKEIETNGNRKRKEGINDEWKQVKLVKFNNNENLVGEKVSPLEFDDSLSSGSEMDDCAATDMEQ